MPSRRCKLGLLLLGSFLLPAFLPAAAQTLGNTLPPTAPDTHLPVPENPALRSLFLVGDAAVSAGPGGTSASGQGWGEPLVAFFDRSHVNVVNRAVTSSSSRAYITEGYWADTLALVKPGDVILIQFGQHEGSGTVSVASALQAIPDQPVETSLPGLSDDFRSVERPGTAQVELVHTYGWYLRQLVVDTIAHGATPVLCSPIPLRVWNASHLVQSRDTYAGWARAIATQQRVGFLDLNRVIAEQDDALGETGTASLFNPTGTNSSLLGAEANARAVVSGLKALQPDPVAGLFSEAGRGVPAAVPPPPTPRAPTGTLQPGS